MSFGKRHWLYITGEIIRNPNRDIYSKDFCNVDESLLTMYKYHNKG